MATYYVDTSVLVSAFSMEERKSEGARQWLDESAIAILMTSDWTITEFSAALSMKVRERIVTPEQRDRIVKRFNRLVAESFEMLRVEANHFREGAHLADRAELGLRAGDALHLAVAQHHDAVVCTQDRQMEKAATALGIGVLLL